MHFRADIQILRGLAVLMVVLFHLNFNFIKNGFLGVDVFFVISGFLMALLYRQGHVREFYLRRASRLLPAYFLTIALTAVISACLLMMSEVRQVTEQSVFASLFLSNVGFWAKNSYFSSSEFNPLLHLWSLGVEIQFYLLVPLLFWFCRKNIFYINIIIIISLLASAGMVLISPKTAFFMMPLRVWQFLIGAWVAWRMTENGKPLKSRGWIAVICLILVLIVVGIYPLDGKALSIISGHPGLAALIVTLGTAGILGYGLPLNIEKSLFGKVFRKLGDWSYSIYLVHFPVIVVILYVPFGGTVLSPSGWQDMVVILSAIVIGSWLFYKLLERPGYRIKSGLSILLLCLVSSFISLASGSLAKYRFNQVQLNISAAFEDRSAYRCGKLTRLVNFGSSLCELTEGQPQGAQKVALIGDSHSDSVKTSFVEVLAERGWSVYFVASNTPLIGSPSADRIISDLKADSIDTVVLHFSNGNAMRALETGFHQMLLLEGISVTWVLPVPVYSTSIPQYLWFQQELQGQRYLKPINSEVNDDLRNALADIEVEVLDPLPLLCPGACLLSDDELRPFYFDSNHLTLVGAKQLAPLWKEFSARLR